MKELTITVQVPDWAAWIAKDYHGYVYCYEIEPKELKFHHRFWRSYGKRVHIAITDSAGWRDSKSAIQEGV